MAQYVNRDGLLAWFIEEQQRYRKFILVGMLNTAVGFGIYSALILLGLVPWLALLIANCAGVTFNFMSTGSLVFKNVARGLFPRFVLTYAIIYFLNLLLLKVLIAAGLNALIAQALSLPVIVTCTFCALRLFVFRD